MASPIFLHRLCCFCRCVEVIAAKLHACHIHIHIQGYMVPTCPRRARVAAGIVVWLVGPGVYRRVLILDLTLDGRRRKDAGQVNASRWQLAGYPAPSSPSTTLAQVLLLLPRRLQPQLLRLGLLGLHQLCTILAACMRHGKASRRLAGELRDETRE